MATPKFKKHYDEMMRYNGDLFTEYLALEAKYDSDPQTFKEELRDLKRKLIRVIRQHEDNLCAKSENTKFGVYAANLAAKFWEEIRANFPRIDESLE